ncbi:hypothetical protein V6N11_050513 [Hibiscus sabdariffa]|uniref:Uncharacterized protein n=2 Tax=Hibiscus sabdariffa TaxID=183260 RepID=A0ABR2TA06_9ROSI
MPDSSLHVAISTVMPGSLFAQLTDCPALPCLAPIGHYHQACSLLGVQVCIYFIWAEWNHCNCGALPAIDVVKEVVQLKIGNSFFETLLLQTIGLISYG